MDMLKYARKSKTISGRLHDEMVLMDLEQGKYFSLNPVATRIWDLLEGPATVEWLCGRLQEEYEVEAETCVEEVSAYIEDMVKLGLIKEEGLYRE